MTKYAPLSGVVRKTKAIDMGIDDNMTFRRNQSDKYSLRNIKTVDSTLDEYAFALRTVDGDSLLEGEVRDFFAGPYSSLSAGSVSAYNHNKMQWVMKDFFDSLGFESERIVNYGYLDITPPQKMSIEHSPDEIFQGIKNATIYYVHKEDPSKKLVLTIRYFDMNNSYDYSMDFNFAHDSIFQEWKSLAQEKNFYKGKKIDPQCRFLKLDDITWDDVILSDTKKQVVRSSIDELFQYTDKLKQFGIPIQRGVIFHGRPGTGKTQICRAVAKQVNCSVLYALPTDFQDDHRAVRRITEMAKDLAPCVLIIEDIDWIALDRDSGRAGFLMELMNQMDGIEAFGDIVTIGTTNRKDDLEDAVRNRPGRFDRLIEVDYPEHDQIVKMINKFSEGWDISTVNIDKLAAKLEGLSGAHVRELCKTAAIDAIKSDSIKGDRLILTNKSFKAAFDEVKHKDFASYMEIRSKNNNKNSFGFARDRSLTSSFNWDED